MLPESINKAALPGATPVPFFRHAYCPVNKENLLGVHVAAVLCALVKRIPDVANLSILGVCTLVAP